MKDVWLHRFSIVLAVCTLFLVIAGALPEMTGGALGERSHHLVATAVGFLTLVLAVWIWKTDERVWLRRLGGAALGAVLLQGVLGMAGVGHSVLGQVFFSTIVAIAIFSSPSWKRGPMMVEDTGWPSIRTLAAAAPLLAVAQVGLGSAYRSGAMAIVPHVIGAFVVTAALLMASMFVLLQFGSHRELKLAARCVMAIAIAQIVLGIGAYLVRVTEAEMAAVTAAHIGAGALTLAASAALAIQVLRNVAPGQHAVTTGGAAVAP
ncbi:MAG: hypothetical protein ACK5AZ_00810 [Bryobacteraceae bacterium]